MPRGTGRRRQASDAKAWRYLGKFEIRRSRRGKFGIYLCAAGKNAHYLGIINAGAAPFARALANVMESMRNPDGDKFLKKHAPPKVVPADPPPVPSTT